MATRDFATALLLGLSGFGQGRLQRQQLRAQTQRADERDKNEMMLRVLTGALSNPNLTQSALPAINEQFGLNLQLQEAQSTPTQQAQIAANEALAEQRSASAALSGARQQRVEDLLPFEQEKIEAETGAAKRRNQPKTKEADEPARLLKFQLDTIDREIKKLRAQGKDAFGTDVENIRNRIQQLERLRLRIGSANQPIVPDEFNSFILGEKKPVSDSFKQFLQSRGLPIPGAAGTPPPPAAEEKRVTVTDQQIKDYLKKNGVPVTDANVKAVRAQLGG